MGAVVTHGNVGSRALHTADALYRRRRITNAVSLVLACLAAALGLLFLGWILWTLLAKGLAGVDWALFSLDTPPPMAEGGLRNAFYGSAVMCLMAIGIGMLTAGIVLAIMVIPFVSSVMREVFLTVPTRLKESAYALGSTKWEVSWDIVLPYTRSAVIGGIFLGLGRALGETMAVAFVIGNSTRFTASLLEPGTTIAALIANDFGEATETYRSALLLLGFVLFVVTFIVLAIAKLMLRRLSRREGNR